MNSLEGNHFQLVRFSNSTISYFESHDIDAVLAQVDTQHQSWLRCMAPYNQADIIKIISHFKVSRYRIRRILSGKPPGIDDEHLEDCLFGNYQILSRTIADLGLKEVRGSFALGSNFFLTFETQGTLLFDNIFNNIHKQTIDPKPYKVDYLMYLAYEELVDNYYAVFDRIAWKLEDLEDLVLENVGNKSTYREIARMRQAIRLGRRNLQAVHAIIVQVNHGNLPWISPTVANLLNTQLVAEMSDLSQEYQSLRSWMSELMEIQRSNMNDQVGRVITRLTVISAIFLPIQFITGLYGMNFDYMPELHWRFAYPAIVVVMAAIAILGWRYAKQQKLFD